MEQAVPLLCRRTTHVLAWFCIEEVAPPRLSSRYCNENSGAGEGIRTLDPNLGKVKFGSYPQFLRLSRIYQNRVFVIISVVFSIL
jgi:hypothetical protein